MAKFENALQFVSKKFFSSSDISSGKSEIKRKKKSLAKIHLNLKTKQFYNTKLTINTT